MSADPLPTPPRPGAARAGRRRARTRGAILDADGPDTVGHDGLRAMTDWAREHLAEIGFEIDVRWVKLDPADRDLAYAYGDWRFALTPTGGPRAGEEQRARGHFVELWRRQPDGAWKLHRDLTLDRIRDA